MATRKSNEVLVKTVLTGGGADTFGATSNSVNERKSPGEETASRQVLLGTVLEVFLDTFPELFEAVIEGPKPGGDVEPRDVRERILQMARHAGPSGFRPVLELYLDHVVLPAETEVRVVDVIRLEDEAASPEGEIIVEYRPRVRSVQATNLEATERAVGPS